MGKGFDNLGVGILGCWAFGEVGFGVLGVLGLGERHGVLGFLWF